MKRQMFFATAFSAALAVGAAAQTGTATPPQQDTKSQQVTITGCLERSAAGTAGTSGTATGTAAAGAGFILSNASAGSGSSASGTSGTAGTPSSPGSKYKLMGGDQEDLTKYVNSKVEIRGTLDRSSAGAAAGAAAGTAASGQSSDANLPTLRVTSVKQVAASCAGGN